MARRKPTVDTNLFAKTESEGDIETSQQVDISTDRQDDIATSQSVDESTERQVAQDVRPVKMAFYLAPETAQALEKAYHELRINTPDAQDRRKLSRSSLVEKALRAYLEIE